MKTINKLLLFTASVLVFSSCYQDEPLDRPVKINPEPTDPIEIYIQQHFIDTYGVAVRFKFVDRYVDQNKRVTPPQRELVLPMLDFLTKFWIEPFVKVPNGRTFFENHVPAEVIMIGSSIYNDDGTITLGTADAGARITLTDVNLVDTLDRVWVLRQLNVIYHEFAHIMHQRHNLPPNWQTISPDGYTSLGSWYILENEQALVRGFVSPYATSTFNEDFAESVAFLLFDPDYYDKYINEEPNCTDDACVQRNKGRALIRKKYSAILNHYQITVGVDLLKIRELVQEKIPQ
jgi:substrate import-associated zinc metallohydrolase lipoprotein